MLFCRRVIELKRPRIDRSIRRAPDEGRICLKQMEGEAGWLTIRLAWAVGDFLK